MLRQTALAVREEDTSMAAAVLKAQTALLAMLDATELWQAQRRSVVASVHQGDFR